MASLVAAIMAFITALANHFVTNTLSWSMLSDGEWVLTGAVTPSAKANLIAGAWADIILYGSQMLAQVLHVMVIPST
jgi:hypothetical protein